MTKLSLVVYNRELVVINDMDTFAHYYCFSKKQRPGMVILKKSKEIEDEIGDNITPIIEFESIDPAIQDDDIL